MITEIAKEEYDSWVEKSEVIEQERCTFSAYIGPHEFVSMIRNNGMLYELSYGWCTNSDEHWYLINPLYRDNGQEGDGI